MGQRAGIQVDKSLVSVCCSVPERTLMDEFSPQPWASSLVELRSPSRCDPMPPAMLRLAAKVPDAPSAALPAVPSPRERQKHTLADRTAPPGSPDLGPLDGARVVDSPLIGLELHRVLAAISGSAYCVSFFDASALCNVPVPWPRSQDLRQHCARPQACDLVLAVSRPWLYQAHPDPFGEQTAFLNVLLDQAKLVHQPFGMTLLFVDFLSIAQRPFAAGQAPCSRDDAQAAWRAARAMPDIFLMADAILHIDDGLSRCPDSCELVQVGIDELEGVELHEVEGVVQVIGMDVSLINAAGSAVKLFDIVLSIDGCIVRSLQDLDVSERAPVDASRCPRAFCRQRGGDAAMVELARAPFGKRNRALVADRGWTHFERFLATIKAALVEHEAVKHVVFSNSKVLSQWIREEASVLRRAAASGEDLLRRALRQFVDDLEGKTFSTSLGFPIIGKENDVLPLPDLVAGRKSDCDLVTAMMRELVHKLPPRWAALALIERQRQLSLAVRREDSKLCTTLLAAAADPNNRGIITGSESLLHVAAAMLSVEIARILLEHDADCSLQDAFGNTAAHVVLLSIDRGEQSVLLFDMVAPTPDVLMLKNQIGISPLQRFSNWAVVADEGGPYAPANTLVKELWQFFPGALGALGSFRRKLLTMLPPNSGTVFRKTQQHCVNGRKFSSEVWEMQDRVEVHVLLLSFGMCLPWSLHEPATDVLARHICLEHRARLTALSFDAVPVSSSTALSAFCEELLVAIEALPLGSPLVLMDNSTGMTTQLLWALRPRLAGALVLNVGAFWAEERLASEAHAVFSSKMDQFVQLFELQAAEQLRAVLPSAMGFVQSVEDAAAMEELYAEAIGQAPETFWNWTAALHQWLKTSPLKGREPLGPLPCVLACGAQSPVECVQRSARRLQRLLPGSTTAFVPHSKSWWQVEGTEQVAFVVALTHSLLYRVQSIERNTVSPIKQMYLEEAADGNQRIAISNTILDT